jgi:hypothetical protein
MKIRMTSNGIEAPLTPFIGKFVANVCHGIISALRTPLPVRTFAYEIEGESVRIEVNRTDVPLKQMSQGFSRVIILDTVRGMLRHLKMADPEGAIRIEVDLEGE